MPMYFLLSGFCLTLGYGKNKYSKISGCCSSLHSTQISGSTIFDSTTFYFKRLTRILPVYYLCFLYALPLSFFVWYFASENSEIRNEIISGSISSLFLVQSWLIEFGQGLNGAAWTVSTIFFFYLVYPRCACCNCSTFTKTRIFFKCISTYFQALGFCTKSLKSCTCHIDGHFIFSSDCLRI